MKPIVSSGLGSTAALLFAFAACAPSSTGSPTPSGGSQYVITRSQIEELSARSAYEVIERLRPRWLRPIPQTTTIVQPMGELPLVYIDNRRAGDIQILESIPIEEIDELRYIDPADATQRWGTGVASGVIEVISRRKPPGK